PITALLKVRQGVVIGKADEQIAQAQHEKAARAVLVGTEQLYWGLLAATQIRAGAQAAVAATEPMAATGLLDAKTALVEGRQAVQAAEAQVRDIEEQLNALLDLPPCTRLELVTPPAPTAPVACADEVVAAALASSPELHEISQDIVKARAATAAAK